MRNVLDLIARVLFGEDIFISYSRQDGAQYAIALAQKLVEEGYECKIDQWGTEPSRKVPVSLKRALKRCSALVIIGTKAAGNSTAVEQEITEFLQTKRPIIPIDIDGSLMQAKWWPTLEGLAVTSDIQPALVPENLSLGRQASEKQLPAQSTIERIKNSFLFQTRAKRLKTASQLTTGVLVLLLLMAGFAGFYAKKQIKHAADSNSQAAAARAEAEEQSRLALHNRATALLEGASSAVAKGNVETARGRLRVIEPPFRKWEWHYLNNILDISVQEIARDTATPTIASFDDHKMLAIGFSDRIEIRDTGGTVLRKVPLANPAKVLSVSPDASRLAYVDRSRIIDTDRIRLLDLTQTDSSPESITNASADHRSELISSLGFSQDSKYLVSGAWSIYFDDDYNPRATGDTIKLWDASSGKLDTTLASTPILGTSVRALAFGSDQSTLAAAIENGTVALWNLNSRKQVQSLGDGNVPFLSVAFTQRQDMLAAGGQDGQLRLWDTTSDPVRQISRNLLHKGAITSVSFSESGETIATGSKDGEIILSSPVNNSRINTLWGHTGAVTGLAFVNNGSDLISSSEDGSVRLWRTQSLESVSTGNGHQLGVRAIAASSDGQYVVSSSRISVRREVRKPSYRKLLLNFPDRSQKIFEDFEHDISVIKLKPDGSKVALGDDHGQVTLLDLKSGERRILKSNGSPIQAIEFLWDSRITAGDKAGVIHVWDQNDDMPSRRITAHPNGVSCLTSDKNRHLLLSCGGEQPIKVWSLDEELPPFVIMSNGNVTALDVSHTGTKFISGDSAGNVEIRELESGQLMDSFQISNKGIAKINLVYVEQDFQEGVDLTDQGRTDLNDRFDQFLLVLHVDGWMEVLTVVGKSQHQEKPSSFTNLMISDDNEAGFYATADPLLFPVDNPLVSSDDAVILWTALDGSFIRKVLAEKGEAETLTWHPNEAIFALGDDDGNIEIWNAELPGKIAAWQAHDEEITLIRFSPSGDRLASVSDDNHVRVWEQLDRSDPRSEWKQVFEGQHPSNILAVAFDSSGNTLVTGSSASDWDNWDSEYDDDPPPATDTLKVWSLSNPAKTTTITPASGDVRLLDYSPDNSILTAALGNGEVIIIHPESLDEISRLPVPGSDQDNSVHSLEFSPDGSRLFVGYTSGVVASWDTQTWTVVLVMSVPESDVTAVDVTSSGTIFTGLSNGSVRAWRGKF